MIIQSRRPLYILLLFVLLPKLAVWTQESCTFYKDIDINDRVYRFFDDKHSETGYKEMLHFIPNKSSSLYKKIVSESKRVNPNMGVELLFELPIPNDYHNQSNLDKEQLLLLIQQASVRFSTMRGLQYYSERRKKFRDYIFDSFRVSDQNSSTPLADPSIDYQGDKNFYVLRDEVGLGRNVQHYVLFEEGNEILILIFNFDDLTYNNLITIADKEKIITAIYLRLNSDTIQVYLTSALRGLENFSQLRARATISMANRLCALVEWFSASLNDTLKNHITQ